MAAVTLVGEVGPPLAATTASSKLGGGATEEVTVAAMEAEEEVATASLAALLGEPVEVAGMGSCQWGREIG